MARAPWINLTARTLMPDLAYALKINPKMRVLVTGGYYDLATPYFEGQYEMHHLPIPKKMQENIEYKYYESGHMVYVNEGVLKMFHDDVANFSPRQPSSICSAPATHNDLKHQNTTEHARRFRAR